MSHADHLQYVQPATDEQLFLDTCTSDHAAATHRFPPHLLTLVPSFGAAVSSTGAAHTLSGSCSCATWEPGRTLLRPGCPPLSHFELDDIHYASVDASTGTSSVNSNPVLDKPLPECHRACCIKREASTTSGTYEYTNYSHTVTDTDNLSPDGYNHNWSPRDMIAFNGFLRGEVEVLCRWVVNSTLCNDRVKGKDFTTHLHRAHGIMSESRKHRCLWHMCQASDPMVKSSLERHMKERHFPVKWACPTCAKTFTREATLMGHFERCTGFV